MAAGLAAFALFWSLLLQSYVSDAFIILFLASVMTAGWFGGTGPGLFCVALCTLSVDYYFIHPRYALVMNAEGVPYFLSFLLSAGCATWLASTRKLAEESQRVHFDKLFDQGPEAIMLVDHRDHVQRINAEFSRIFGYSTDEIIDGVSLRFIVPELLHNEAMESRAKLLNGESVSMDTIRMRKDGTLVNVSEIAVPVSTDGQQMSFYYLFRDITENKLAADALERAHSELVHLSRVTTIGELVTSIAHEVNQPITAVITYGNAANRWLSQEPPNLVEVKDALGNIVRDATRAGEVIGRIRTLVQKGTPQMTPLDVNEVIRSVLTLLDAEIRRSGVRVKADLGLIPGVIGDRVQLQQVMLNLIINAIDAMSAVQMRKSILSIHSSLDGDKVLIQVEDTGVGIMDGQADMMFNPFFTTKPEGIGMGLTISRSIIEAHGGALWADSGESGAILNFTLPSAGESNEAS
jgi:PAS domain S-box-containing protein